ARARTFGERDEARAGVERSLGAPRHDFEALARRSVRNGHVTEPAHHPAVDRNLEMRFQLEAAHELRNRGVDHERVEDVYVIAYEDAGARGIESRRALDFEFHAREAKDISEEEALRGIVAARVDKQP